MPRSLWGCLERDTVKKKRRDTCPFPRDSNEIPTGGRPWEGPPPYFEFTVRVPELNIVVFVERLVLSKIIRKASQIRFFATIGRLLEDVKYRFVAAAAAAVRSRFHFSSLLAGRLNE